MKPIISGNEKHGVSAFCILALTQGQWGERIAANITKYAPNHWVVYTWEAPRVLPPVIDYPEDFLPESLPEATLLLALGDTAGVAQLIPDFVQMSKAKAVIAPIDHNASLPSGLTKQLEQWLAPMGVPVIFPKPFCSLTEITYNQKPVVKSYKNEIIREFARAFGKPAFTVSVESGFIKSVEVIRDSACGCTRGIADKLPGTEVDNAIERTGMLHHHFPCFGSMDQDSIYHDTLMHVSGNIFKDALKEEIRDDLKITIIRPVGYVEKVPLSNA
jgi:hypothetical protein